MEFKLSDVVEIISGGTPKRKESSYWNGDINWLSVKDFNNNNRLVYTSSEKITEAGLKNSSANLAEKGTVIISARGTVGEVCQISKAMAFNQSCYGLNAITNYTTNEYIYYWLKYKSEYLKRNTHGSVFDTITRKTFDNLYIDLPSIRYQKVISKILKSIDDRIELNQSIIANLEDLSQILFKRWFVDFEFPDEDGNPYKSSGGEMIDSELGKIPKNWEIKSLKDFIEIIDNRGKTPPLDKKSKKYPIIDVKALSGISRIIDYEKCSKFVSEDTYNSWFRNGHPKRGDILLSTVGSIGEIKMFHYDIGTIAQNVVALRSKNPYFTYDLINKIKSLFLTYNIGSVQPSIKITHINKIKVIYPLEKIIEIYEEKIKKYIDFIFLKSSENKKLITLRDTLLPKLMSGEIEIPDDMEMNNDELSI